MKKKICMALISCLMISTLGGCGVRTGHLYEEPEVVLTDRQKDILKEVGLPTEYDELTSSQQDAIMSIEEMLSYVEDKYDMSFSYDEYWAPTILDRECMSAYPTRGDRDYDYFVITRTEEGLVDDYMEHAANPYFMDYVAKGINEFCPKTKVKVYGEITYTTLTKLPNEETDFTGKVAGPLYVFLDGATFQKEELDAFEENFIEFLTRKGIESNGAITILNEEEFIRITKYNFDEFGSEETCIGKIRFNINL